MLGMPTNSGGSPDSIRALRLLVKLTLPGPLSGLVP